MTTRDQVAAHINRIQHGDAIYSHALIHFFLKQMSPRTPGQLPARPIRTVRIHVAATVEQYNAELALSGCLALVEHCYPTGLSQAQ